MKICKKVFMQKRKKFDSAANRLGELEGAKQLVANAHKIEKEKEKVAAATEGGDAGKAEKVPAWKQKSLAFRQAVLAARADTGDEAAAAEAQAIQQQLQDAGPAPGMLKCPHCGRTFNKDAGERHIKICEKTFGKKAGGGRLEKGGGRRMGAGPAATPQAPPQEVSSTARAPSASGGANLGNAKRSSSSGAPRGAPAPEAHTGFAGRRVAPGHFARS